MKTSFVALALAASALANPMPQAVTSAVAPEAATPSGCSDSRDGTFQITVVNVTSSSSKRGFERRQELAGTLTLSLEGGTLKDQADRTGYIASNFQFQFDDPPQAGAIYTHGFSVCDNNTLALGGSAIWYQCYSGGFYNLYDRNWAEHCNAIYIYAMSGEGGATQATDGQPAAPTNPPAPVSAISDGQPQAPTNPVAPITQISDGQIQVPTGVPVSIISDGQIQVPTGAPVSVISDGQIQAPTGAPVSVISDGQIQAPTGVPVSVISDGQIQAPTGVPVSVISDGQIQAPTGVPVSVISDGQIQAPTGVPVSQSPDGQPIAPTGAGNFSATSPRLPEFTGAAATPMYGIGAVGAGLLAIFAML